MNILPHDAGYTTAIMLDLHRSQQLFTNYFRWFLNARCYFRIEAYMKHWNDAMVAYETKTRMLCIMIFSLVYRARARLHSIQRLKVLKRQIIWHPALFMKYLNWLIKSKLTPTMAVMVYFPKIGSFESLSSKLAKPSSSFILSHCLILDEVTTCIQHWNYGNY